MYHLHTFRLFVHTTLQLRCDADISIIFCSESPQLHCILVKMNLTFMQHRNAVTSQFLCRTVQCGNTMQLRHCMNKPYNLAVFFFQQEFLAIFKLQAMQANNRCCCKETLSMAGWNLDNFYLHYTGISKVANVRISNKRMLIIYSKHVLCELDCVKCRGRIYCMTFFFLCLHHLVV